jgi:hypothetical protein
MITDDALVLGDELLDGLALFNSVCRKNLGAGLAFHVQLLGGMIWSHGIPQGATASEQRKREKIENKCLCLPLVHQPPPHSTSSQTSGLCQIPSNGKGYGVRGIRTRDRKQKHPQPTKQTWRGAAEARGNFVDFLIDSCHEVLRNITQRG